MRLLLIATWSLLGLVRVANQAEQISGPAELTEYRLMGRDGLALPGRPGVLLQWTHDGKGYALSGATVELPHVAPVQLSREASFRLVMLLGVQATFDDRRYLRSPSKPPGPERPHTPPTRDERRYFEYRLAELAGRVEESSKALYCFEDSDGQFVIVYDIGGRLEGLASSPLFCGRIGHTEMNDSSELRKPQVPLPGRLFHSDWGEEAEVVAIGLEGAAIRRDEKYEIRHVRTTDQPTWTLDRNKVQIPAAWTSRLGKHVPALDADKLVGLSVLSPSRWSMEITIDPEVLFEAWTLERKGSQ